MNSKYSLFLLFTSLVIFLNQSCAQSNNKESYKEILETKYEKRLHPSDKPSKYNIKQEKLLIYINNLLVEEEISFYHGKKVTESKYVYTYNNNKNVASISFYKIGDETPITEQTFTYNTEGQWVGSLQKGDKGRVNEHIKVISRDDQLLIAEGLGSPRSLHIKVTNQGKDSLVEYDGNKKSKHNHLC